MTPLTPDHSYRDEREREEEEVEFVHEFEAMPTGSRMPVSVAFVGR